MSEPDTEHAAGPVTPQTPVVSKLWLGSDRLYSVFGWFSYRHNSSCWSDYCLPSTRQNGSGISVTFPVSDNDILDWTFIFFLGTTDTSFCNRCSDSSLVASLD